MNLLTLFLNLLFLVNSSIQALYQLPRIKGAIDHAFKRDISDYLEFFDLIVTMINDADDDEETDK